MEEEDEAKVEEKEINTAYNHYNSRIVRKRRRRRRRRNRKRRGRN